MLFLHIGRGNSGSTTIQRTTLANREAMAERGVLCPKGVTKSKGHYAQIARWLRGKGPAPTEITELISDNPSANFFVSSEFLFAEKNLPVVDRLFAPHPVRIIAYVRDYPSWVRSYYAQSSKTGKNVADFDGFYRRVQNTISARRALSNWVSVFGAENIVVRPMGSALTRRDLIEDLSELINVPLAPQDNENTSRHWLETEFRRALYIHDPEPGRMKRAPREAQAILTVVRKCIAKFSVPDVNYLTRQQRRDLVELFNQDAGWIEATLGKPFPVLPDPSDLERPFLPTLRHAPKGLIALVEQNVAKAGSLRDADYARAAIAAVRTEYA